MDIQVLHVFIAELLDDQRFSRNILPDEKQLSQVMIRRLKTDLVDSDGNPIYPKRKLQTLPVPFTADERAIHQHWMPIVAVGKRPADSGSTGTKFVNGLLKSACFRHLRVLPRRSKNTSETLTTEKVAAKSDALTDRILQSDPQGRRRLCRRRAG